MYVMVISKFEQKSPIKKEFTINQIKYSLLQVHRTFFGIQANLTQR